MSISRRLIDDTDMARLKRESARTGRTMSEPVETMLRRLPQHRPDSVDLPPLPSFQSGGAFVDLASREARSRVMEGRCMCVVDTNVLVYAVDASAPEHDRCRALLEGWRRSSGVRYITLGICASSSAW